MQPRREFLRRVGAGSAALLTAPWRITAGPFTTADFAKLVPADKKLHPEWVRSLTERGTRTVYRGAELEKIGMPVGGICAGQLYLGGEGKLWHWDIFNQHKPTGAEHYAKRPRPSSPLDQGFALRVLADGKADVRAMDHTGWSDISFIGEYPIGFVDYRDPACPVSVSLRAFSPFIPLNAEDSALPATVMQFTLSNTSAKPITAELAGWMENAVCLHSAEMTPGTRHNRIVRSPGFTLLECSAQGALENAREPKRPDVVFDDFERETYEGWTATGTAFGSGPVPKARVPEYQGDLNAHGRSAVNSHASAPTDTIGGKDGATGTLTSKPFVIERNFIKFLIGGGGHKGRTCLNLLVDDKVILSAIGKNNNRMEPASFSVRRWAGRTAKLQIVDKEKGGWGNIGVDYIVFSDEPVMPPGPLSEQADFGTTGLALLRSGTDDADSARAALPDTGLPSQELFNVPAESPVATSRPFDSRLVGSLSRKLALAPGASATVTFLLTWHFPNLKLAGLGDHGGRWYGKRFDSATAVAEYVAQNFSRLDAQTVLWHDTWYDSTLPYWLLDRSFLNASILATSTCFWLGNGRFYGWEGVGCCAGTCTHVWHYAHAGARLFPPLERAAREMADYGVGFDPATGFIRFRAEHNKHWAVDGQAGVILRTYREHQMSADNAFLRRVWPRAKQALVFLIGKDTGADGIVDGPQHNTLDADWYGQVAWLSGLYLAALRAGEEMAREMGDAAFAAQCRAIFEEGQHAIDEKLFNGEYYIQLGDPAHRKTVGSYDDCEIDQVFGQSWAWQVGLGRVLDEARTKTALRSLWRYNFTPDVGPYRAAYKPGRWYAMAGEGGLLMCSWPRGEAQRVPGGFDAYFNECMTGFEYQAAWHMIAEGMVMEGLAVARMIHDRYHALRRNPWNEVECGDHYARAMASYGVFLAACGYEHHGPRGHLGFAPRLTPENFRAPFTTAEGWGTFSQKTEGRTLKAEVEVKWGKLRLRTLALQVPDKAQPTSNRVTANGQPVVASHRLEGNRLTIVFPPEVVIPAGQKLEVELS